MARSNEKRQGFRKPYRLAREDRIPHLRFGRTLRFRSEAIVRWLEE